MSKQSLVPLNVLASASAPTVPTLKAGDLYFNTVNNTLYTYSGTGWVSSGGSSSALYGLEANKPTAGIAGRTWISTDTYSLIGNVGFMWLDNGTSWEKVGLLPQDIYDSINGAVGYALGVDADHHTAALAYTDTKIAQEVLDRNVNIANAKNEAIGISETYADGKIATELARAQAAEALLAPKASPVFTGTVTTPLTTAGYVTTTSGGVLGSVSTIPNVGLTNSSVTIGTTAIALGASSTTITGLTSVSSTTFSGSFTDPAFTVAGYVTNNASGVLSTVATIPNAGLTNSSITIGNTAYSLGGSTTTLTGLSSVTSTAFVGALTGNATTVTNGVYTTDTGTVTNTMLAGSITNAKLQYASLTLGSTSVALGSTTTTLSGFASLTSTSFVGALTGNATTATTLATPRAINGVNFDGSTAITIKAATTNPLTIGTGLSGTSFDGSGAVTITIDTATTVDKTTAQTLTNKRLNSPQINDTSLVTTTGTELNYVAGVTSGIQAQLNAKAASSQLSSYQPISSDLSAIAALNSGIGNLRRTGSGTWAIDTNTYALATSPTINTSIIAGTTSFNLLNTLATTINFGGAATTMAVGSNDATSVLTLNAPTVIGNLNYINLYNTVATTVNFAGAATSLTIGGTPSTAITHNYSTNPTASGVTKTVNLATGNASGAVTVVNVGSATDSATSSLNVNIPAAYNSTITVPYPTSSNQAANKQYVDNVAAGIIIKGQVYLGTTGSNLNSVYANGSSDSSGGLGIGATLTAAVNGALYLDGILVTVNSRVLIKDQTDQKQNGVYVVTNPGAGDAKWVLTRATDFNGSGTSGVIKPGAYIFVTNGTYYANASYVVSTSGTSTSPSGAIKLGTDVVTFAQYSGVPLNISTLGNVTIGTWQATPISATYIDTAIARTASPTFTGSVTVPVVPVNTTDAVSKKYVDDLVLASLPYLPDIIPLDDLRYVFDGRTSRFAPKFQGIQQTLYNPYKLMINLNGIVQTPSYPEQTWLSLLPYDGFILDSDGYIAFSQVPPAGSTFDGRVMLGPNINTIHKSYPFKAVDVLLGI